MKNLYNKCMTIQANKDLESAVLKNDNLRVKKAFENGASIAYKAGNFFSRACTKNNVEIVNLFVTQPSFVKHANICYKKYSNAHFHDGLLFASSQGHLGTVQYMTTSKIYTQIDGFEDLCFKCIEQSAEVKRENIVSYYLEYMNFENNNKLKEFINSLSENIQSFIKTIQLKIKLNKNLLDNQKLKRMKI